MPKAEKPDIFRIPIDNRPQYELERVIRRCLDGTAFTRIATVNPEFLVRAHRDVAFTGILQKADIRIADGSGIVLAGLLFGFGVSRYPGVDLMRYILSKAEQSSASVFLVVKKGGLSSFEQVRKALLVLYPKLVLNGDDIDPESETKPAGIYDAAVVLCNFGAPEQERFLESLRPDSGSIRLVMGVGGAFDFLTGRQRRAPRWMRFLGLEWLFRLLIQPKRITRIWTALVIFPFLCLSDRIGRSRKSIESKVKSP
jgi:N-acetylglucosaminyldiphosphoundecaprenol N-acetyl-beta-D-mannosaminyltransferase